jgi:hypothetical protein
LQDLHAGKMLSIEFVPRAPMGHGDRSPAALALRSTRNDPPELNKGKPLTDRERTRSFKLPRATVTGELPTQFRMGRWYSAK